MDNPIGREDIARVFKNALDNGKLCQTYIIHAPEGMGKKTVFKYIASLILCADFSSCGKCPSCKSLLTMSHPDMVELKRDPDKASIGVENVRDIKAEVYTRPVMSDYKVVAVYEAHLATVAAQNAMLKMIEEPPDKVVFFLLCDTLSPILSTVLSRAVVIELKPLCENDMKRIFSQSAESFEISLALGNPGKLIKLKEDLGYMALRDEVIDAFSYLTSEDSYAPYMVAERLDKIKENKDRILSILLSFARDAYFRKIGLNQDIANKDKLNYIDTFCAPLTEKACYKILEHIISTQKYKGKNGNLSIALTVLMLKCRSEMTKK